MKIIWLVVSHLRADHLGAYGNRWLPTQYIDALAGAGRLFTGAKSVCADSLTIRMQWLTGKKDARFPGSHDFFTPEYRSTVLPVQLSTAGFKTALLTDNYPMLTFYEQLAAFDTVLFVPGQGADRHCPEEFSSEFFSNIEKHPHIVTGSSHQHDDTEMNRFFKNRLNDSDIRPPADRLFDAAGRFLDQLNPRDNYFILIDAFGLTPPWFAPLDVKRFRRPEDASSLAWPLKAEIDLNHPSTRGEVNFLRRSYADACLHVDTLLGTLSPRIMTYFNSVEPFRFLLLSDLSPLVGDDGFVLSNSTRDHPTLTREVMIALGHDIDEHSQTNEAVSPVDLFTTTVEKTGIPNPLPGDGKVIEDL